MRGLGTISFSVFPIFSHRGDHQRARTKEGQEGQKGQLQAIFRFKIKKRHTHIYQPIGTGIEGGVEIWTDA